MKIGGRAMLGVSTLGLFANRKKSSREMVLEDGLVPEETITSTAGHGVTTTAVPSRFYDGPSSTVSTFSSTGDTSGFVFDKPKGSSDSSRCLEARQDSRFAVNTDGSKDEYGNKDRDGSDKYQYRQSYMAHFDQKMFDPKKGFGATNIFGNNNLKLGDIICYTTNGLKKCGVLFDNGYLKAGMVGKQKKNGKFVTKPPEATAAMHAVLGDRNADGGGSILNGKPIKEQGIDLKEEDRLNNVELMREAINTGDYSKINAYVQTLAAQYNCS